MATYIRGGSSVFSDSITNAPTLTGVQVDSVGGTIFAAYHYRNTPSTALVAAPTWNGETFTELVNDGNKTGDDQHVLQVFYLTTASSGTYSIVASNAEWVIHTATWAVYSDVTAVSPIENENMWDGGGLYVEPSLTVTGTGTVLNILAPTNYDSGWGDLSATTWSADNSQTVRQSAANTGAQNCRLYLSDIESTTSQALGWTPSAWEPTYTHAGIFIGGTGGVSISSTNPTVDQVQSSITTTGLTTATSASLGGDTLTLGGTIPNLTYTYDTAGILIEQSVPRIGETVTLSVTGAEGTATESVVTAVKSGWAFVTLTSTDKTAGGLLAHLDSDLSKTTAIGDQLYYNSASNTSITAAGVLTTDATSFEMVLIQGGDATNAGTGTPATVNTAAVGGGSGSAIKSINISSIKIGL